MEGFSSSRIFPFFVLVSHWILSVETVSIPDLLAIDSNSSLPITIQKSTRTGHFNKRRNNIILNPTFDNGLSNWSGKGCDIVLHESMGDGKILPLHGKFFASATNRTGSWNGIQQEITGRVQLKLAYEVIAVVRIYGGAVSNAGIQATLWVQSSDFHDQYIIIAMSQATDKDWVQLQGKFLLNVSPLRVIIFLEGPPSGTDVLINSLVVRHAKREPHSIRPIKKHETFGVNLIENSNLNDGTNGWFPVGHCTLNMGIGSPVELPPMARDSLGLHGRLSGRYLLVTNRTETWMGPAQMINGKLKLYFTYQVSAWVRIATGSTSPQMVNVALGMDGNWVNGGQVELNDESWHEVGGSFRIEKQPTNVMVYLQGPAAGIDLMVAGLWIFAVDRKKRFKILKDQTDKIRKRDVILKFSGSEVVNISSGIVKVKQMQNSFPLGSCITRRSIDNEGVVRFLVNNFNWVVFGNELKWSWTEPQPANFNYKDADELLNFCENNNLEIRGHCIFWEMEYAIQPWVRSLNNSQLMTAIQNRLTDLLPRYKGKFRHYDVDNEMLHGSFYKDRLGKDIQVNMFKTSHQLDPSATLFVNDYHIEDGSDIRSSPEEYIRQIISLQQQGAPVGGIGIQGHIDSPVGSIVSSALNKLGTLGLPIWFTELDVSSSNEFVRAEDLEVMMREAFAHPAVEGIILWGFWELYMSRENAHLVNAEGKINTAGKRFLDLKKEWLSQAYGHIDGHIDARGEFKFRGFHGTYNIEIHYLNNISINRTFVVDRGDLPLEINIDL